MQAFWQDHSQWLHTRVACSKDWEGLQYMAMSDRWRMSEGLRRTSAVVAVAALAIGGAKVASDYTTSGTGFSTVQTAAADPTGPGGPTGGPGMDGGQQFQPPQMPSSMPDYQGGNNQPPLDQNSGISIYNTGSPGAQQVPGQQAGQQPQQGWDHAAHGTQPPNYSTAPGYTQGPGQPNPNYQAPQQQSPQQGQQPQQQQPSQAPSQQPSQAPTQTQQPEQPKQDDDNIQRLDNRQQKCQLVAEGFGNALSAVGSIPSLPSGSLPRLGGPSRSWNQDPPPPVPSECNGQCPPPKAKQEPKIDVEKHWWGWSEKIRNPEGMQKTYDDLGDVVTALMGCTAATGTAALVLPPPFDVILGIGAGICGAGAAVWQHQKDMVERTMRDGMCLVINNTWAMAYWTQVVACG